jgi:hypothetical protein
MMVASSISETSANSYQTTQCNIPEDNKLRDHRRDNLKSDINLMITRESVSFSEKFLYHGVLHYNKHQLM